MSENKRSFWASVPGLVTGLAGLLTGIVGLITLLVQLDVIGGDKAKTVSTDGTSTTVAGSPTTLAGSPTTLAGVTTTVPSSFTLNPQKLTFAPTDVKEKTVTVRNTSTTTDLRLTAPTVTGTDKNQFVPTLGDCPSTLRPNAVCTMKVTFTPGGPLKNYTATVQVSAMGAPSQQVEITASTIL